MIPSHDFWNWALPQEARQAMHVCHSLYMVGRLPMERESAPTQALADAALESWLVHVRLLTEFLLVKPANPELDFSARDFGWEGDDGLDGETLVGWWHVASSHLVHLGRERAPDDPFDLEPEDVSCAALVSVSQGLLDLAEAFVLHLEATETPVAPHFRDCLESAAAELATRADGA